MGAVAKGNAVIGQSGGPTAVINQSLVGVIESVKTSGSIGRLLGARHGVRGIVDENFIDLSRLKQPQLEQIAATPAAALGSTRDKPDAEYCRRIFKVFAKNDVRYFFYIGGNDSADTARIVNELAARDGYELRVFHIPKTIDNDLCATDHTPGYGSAARFVASAFMGENCDNNSLPGIKISVVMGRHAGWVTAASSLGRTDPTDGPHLVYVPEVPFDVEQFIEDVKDVYGKLGRCLVAVSEGISDETHTPVAVALGEKLGHRIERDSHGNVQLSGSGALGDFLADYIRTSMKQRYKTLRVRADTYGYLQRSFAGYASPVDQVEARLVGRKAVEFATAGDLDGSVVFKRLPGKKYKIQCVRAKLSDVAKDTRELPHKYINRAGNNITPSFKDYALPLTGGLPVVGKLA